MKRSSTSERLKQIMGERNLRQVDILNAAKRVIESGAHSNMERAGDLFIKISS